MVEEFWLSDHRGPLPNAEIDGEDQLVAEVSIYRVVFGQEPAQNLAMSFHGLLPYRAGAKIEEVLDMLSIYFSRRPDPTLHAHQALLSSSEKLAWVSTQTREDQGSVLLVIDIATCILQGNRLHNCNV
jgi:hypothetical protein